MNKTNSVLSKKAFGILQSIEKIGKWGDFPSVEFGEDVNKLIKKAKEENPDISELLPEPVTFYDDEYRPGTDCTFGEIHSRLSQIYQMLSE